MPRARKTAAAPTPDIILAAAWNQVAEQGWKDLTLGDIAESVPCSMAALIGLIGDKSGLPAATMRLLDAQLIEGGGGGESGPPAERLFDILMRRFDALAPYKAGIRALCDDRLGALLMVPATAPGLVISMGWMLELAGLGGESPADCVKAIVLAGAWMSVVKVWLGDDSPDLGKTMAALDKKLKRLDGLAAMFSRGSSD